MASTQEINPVKLGGIGTAVEVDEMFVKYDEITGSEVSILGAVEKTGRKWLYMSVIRSKNTTTIVNSLSDHILPGSLLVTDNLASYSRVAKVLNVPHARVNKSRTFVDRASRIHTNTIEGVWKHLRRFLSNHQTLELETAINEFVWRKNNKDGLWEAFLDSMASIEWN